jgi:hypothetical protein
MYCKRPIKSEVAGLVSYEEKEMNNSSVKLMLLCVTPTKSEALQNSSAVSIAMQLIHFLIFLYQILKQKLQQGPFNFIVCGCLLLRMLQSRTCE